MSTETAVQRMTAESFADWVEQPENRNRWFELVRGEGIELPPPGKIHGRVCVNVVFELERYVRQRRKGYVTSNDTGVILERDPDTVRGPDVAIYLEKTKFRQLKIKYSDRLPKLIVEALSP